MNISALRNFSEDENNFIDECKVAGSIDIERLCKLNTHRDILSLEKADSVILSKDIEIARKGIRFCTRIAFRLGDLLQKVGSSVYIISNMYLFDYIEDIHKAVKHDNVIFGSSHYKIRLSKPTAIPTTDMWIFYEFNEEDLMFQDEEKIELDEYELISFLNEYYDINPNSLPKPESY